MAEIKEKDRGIEWNQPTGSFWLGDVEQQEGDREVLRSFCTWGKSSSRSFRCWRRAAALGVGEEQSKASRVAGAHRRAGLSAAAASVEQSVEDGEDTVFVTGTLQRGAACGSGSAARRHDCLAAAAAGGGEEVGDYRDRSARPPSKEQSLGILTPDPL